VIALLLVFYGKGKGKTTAALGTLLRFLGYGGRALVMQFMKSGNSGEYRLYRKLSECGLNVKWFCLGTDELVNPNDLGSEAASVNIAKGLGFLLYEYPKLVKEFQPSLTVFDELGLAVHMGLIPADLALNILSSFTGSSELHAIVTGRYVPKYLRDIADLVTNCREEKHYFRKGYVNLEGLDV